MNANKKRIFIARKNMFADSRKFAGKKQREGSTMQVCEHFSEIKEAIPSADGCKDCLNIGGRWVHLRLCLSCGHVGCCDSSPNKHATRHFHAENHPVIKSFEKGEDWVYCYVDEAAFESLPE